MINHLNLNANQLRKTNGIINCLCFRTIKKITYQEKKGKGLLLKETRH